MKINNVRFIGIGIAILGIVMFSTKAVLVKLIYQYDTTTIHALLFRMLFSLPFYILILFIYKPKNRIGTKQKHYLWVVVLGIVGYYLASLFDFAGLQYISASLERTILFVYPTLVLIISAVFLRTKIIPIQILAILLTYFGVILAFSGEVIQSGENKMLGGFFILMSALTYASYLVGSQWLIPKFGVRTFTSYAMIVSCLCVIIHYIIIDGSQFWHYPKEVYLLSLAMAIFCTIIPSFLVSEAIKRLGASDFAILAGLGPIFTILLAGIFLEERLNWQQGVGALIVILGVYIISFNKKK